MDFSFKIEVRGSYRDQQNLTLIAYQNQEQVGYIDYAVWRGLISVEMIQALTRGVGVGPAMVRRLQREYPDSEINFGLATDEGARMLAKMETVFIPNPEYDVATKRLAKIKAILAKWHAFSDEVHTNPTPMGLARLRKMGDAWNRLNDQEWYLEADLRDMQPGKRLIKI